MYVSQPYAPLLARVEPNINGSNHMVVWLRGGGCVYNISSSYNLDDNTESISRTGILIKYEEFNFGFNETYPVIFGPIALADIDQYNKGIYTTGKGAAYSYYRAKSAESADTANTATNAGTANIATTANSLSMDSVGDSNSAMLPSAGFKVYKYTNGNSNTGTKGLDGFIQSFTLDSRGVYGAQIYVDGDPTGIMALRQRSSSGT